MVPVPKAWTFDSSKASPTEEAELKTLLDDCDFFGAPDETAKSQTDRGNLSILVETEQASKRLTLSHGNVPPRFAGLVRFIEQRLQWRPRKP